MSLLVTNNTFDCATVCGDDSLDSNSSESVDSALFEHSFHSQATTEHGHRGDQLFGESDEADSMLLGAELPSPPVQDERATPTQAKHNNNHDDDFVMVPADSSYPSLDLFLRRSSTCSTTASSNTSENTSSQRSDLFDAQGRINWEKEGDWIQAYVNLLHLTPTKRRTCGCGLRRSGGGGHLDHGHHSVTNSPLHTRKSSGLFIVSPPSVHNIVLLTAPIRPAPLPAQCSTFCESLLTSI